ncbi:phospholipase D-like domain-containing protein [Sorangium sp. So ce136]|uniref:phospholipase D-like domain-containing protein n=1 Tax=Sorangium sp. So ce136 TaxID=3133284 RepID=UPI003F066008
MASFDPLFDPVRLERVLEATITLPDPPQPVPAPDPIVITRPGVARHAARRVTLLQVRLRAGELAHTVTSPVRAAVRRVALDPAAPLPGGGVELLELSPLPFLEHTPGAPRLLEETLRRLGTRGVPTFYVAPFAAVAAALPPAEPLDDALLLRGAPIVELTPGAVFSVGVLFQDGTALPPVTAFGLIADALEAAGDGAAAAAWRAQLATLGGPARRFVAVRHDGGPLGAAAGFDLELRRDADGVAVATASVNAGADGDLEPAAAASPVGSLFAPPPGHHVAVRWAGDAPTGASLPVQSLVGTRVSSPPGGFLRVPALAEPRATLEVLDLARWYPPVPPGHAVERYHTNSLVIPLVDGMAAFQALVEDLRACIRTPADPPGARFRAHLTGWTFNRFQLLPGGIRTDIVELAEDILARDGAVLVLANRFLSLRDPELSGSRAAAVLLLFALGDATLLTELLIQLAASVFNFSAPTAETDDWVVFAWFALPAVAGMLGLAVAELGWLEGLLERKLETARETVDDLNALAPGTAVWSSNPVRLADNPLAPLYGDSPLFGLEDDADQFGVYHNKMQLVRRRADARGDEFVGFLGGIDVNRNRLDSPGHQIGGPYHDVHARFSGPVVADAFRSFYERWVRDAGIDPDTLENELPAPVAAAMPQHTGARHIARIGRTYPRSTPALQFAPGGDRGTYDTLLAAIGQARDHIYIEEQYFTPDDVFVDALRAAGGADRCRRLLIVVPGEGDQPFGDLRRRHVFARLREVWGDRMIVGYPQRRPRLRRADRFASRGRAWLVGDLAPGATELYVGPPARAIGAPSWLWVDGELMLARSVTRPVVHEGEPAARIVVDRGGISASGRWGAHPRAHRAGTAVTFSQPAGIYVHAKCMMIDDVFVSIGSTNLNRRGFFHDGEINVFAIPEELRGAPDNPARALRTALWAEHLGIPPAQGGALLGDAIAGFELFRRPHLGGSRFAPLESTDVRPFLSLPDTQLWPTTLLGALALLLGSVPAGFLSFFHRTAWNLVIDPTTGTDPAPTEGPVP